MDTEFHELGDFLDYTVWRLGQTCAAGVVTLCSATLMSVVRDIHMH
jgi:hypothetical protein